ncbi:hypothetical protein [Rhodocista pekingensis]|uniref:Glycosyltransferase RgtA/B/C/D-like domain-containing protein n=1 Tax=Rhodocista pekingensis TaxID=201185 RepID=A0ABW2KVF4_9PROT
MLVLKYFVFFLDSTPRFFMGDSASYIHTAMTGWIPSDRSFLYGYLIRIFSGPQDGLTTFLAVQVLVSAGAAILAGLAARIAAGASMGTATVVALVVSLEPLQLAYERYVMAETFAGLMLAILVVSALWYLRKPALLPLLSFVGAGIGLVSLRLNTVPLVWSLAFILPVLSVARFPGTSFGPFRNPNSARFARVALHVVLLLALTAVTHGVYRHVYGALRDGPPGYQHADGLFAVAGWAPLIRADAFPDAFLAEQILSAVAIDLSDPGNREAQRWSPTGISYCFEQVIGNPYDANRLAREVAFRAALNDPVAVFRLGFHTVSRYLDPGQIRASLRWDQGENPITENLASDLRSVFAVDVARSVEPSPVRSWHGFPVNWYILLPLMPCVAFLCIPFVPTCSRPEVGFLVIVGFGLVACGPFLGTMTVVRYLHPLAWLNMVLFAVIGHSLLKARLSAQKASPVAFGL